MPDLREQAAAWLARGWPAVVVEVTEARGSAPREAGTRMLVDATGASSTIGGGHLELKAIAEARAMLAEIGPPSAEPARRCAARSRHYPLGPALGQCCGGAVTLSFSPLDAATLDAWPKAPPRFH